MAARASQMSEAVVSGSGSHRSLRNIARSAALAPVFAYQRLVSPLFPRRCKYEPTCSAYAVRAVRDYGILRGLVLAMWRLLRCNPWSHGGYDPVAAQRLFRPHRDARM